MQARVLTPLALAMAVEAEMAVEMAAAGEVAHHPLLCQDGVMVTPLLATRMSATAAAAMEEAAAAMAAATKATAAEAIHRIYTADPRVSRWKA